MRIPARTWRVAAALVLTAPLAVGSSVASATPAPPTGVGCTPTGTGEITVWTDTVSGETSAEVRDVYTGQSWVFHSADFGYPLEIAVDGLDANQNYSLQLRVSDSTGTSSWSTPCDPVLPRPIVGNLVLNPSAEQSLAYWQSLHGTLTRAVGGSPDTGGSYSIKVARASGTFYNVSDSALAGAMPTVLKADAGSYMGAAWVKAATKSAVGKTVAIGLRERNLSGASVRDTTRTTTLSSTWRSLWVSAPVLNAGDTIGVRVEQRGAVSGDAMFVDDVHVHPYRQFMQTADAPQTVGVVDPDVKRVSLDDFTSCGQGDEYWINCEPVRDLTTLSAYIDGQAGGSGTATVRGVIYSGYESPGTLLETSKAVTVKAGQKPGWVDLPLPHPLEVQATAYWFGYQVGGTSRIVRFYGDNSSYCYQCGYAPFTAWNKDLYPDGPSKSFGAYTAGKATTMMRGSGGA